MTENNCAAINPDGSIETERDTINRLVKNRDELARFIQSQKEEIEKLKSRLEAKYTFISNGMEEDQYVLQESVIAKDAEIESLKAITELAVKGLKEIKDYEIQWFEDAISAMRTVSSSTLSEIEKLQK